MRTFDLVAPKSFRIDDVRRRMEEGKQKFWISKNPKWVLNVRRL